MFFICFKQEIMYVFVLLRKRKISLLNIIICKLWKYLLLYVTLHVYWRITEINGNSKLEGTSRDPFLLLEEICFSNWMQNLRLVYPRLCQTVLNISSEQIPLLLRLPIPMHRTYIYIYIHTEFSFLFLLFFTFPASCSIASYSVSMHPNQVYLQIISNFLFG